MAFGTDAVVCRLRTSGKQFASCEVRNDPMQAIQAALPMRDLLGHASELGSIKPGKYADLSRERRSLKDSAYSRTFEFVMKDGKGLQVGGSSSLLPVRDGLNRDSGLVFGRARLYSLRKNS